MRHHPLSLFLYAFFIFSLFSINSQAQDKKLALIGVVLEKTIPQPIHKAKVELFNPKNKEKKQYTTEPNGAFMFLLEKETFYILSLFNKAGKIVDKKKIITLGKVKNELIHIILEGNMMAPEDYKKLNIKMEH